MTQRALRPVNPVEKKGSRGFTLLELLVSLSILGLVAGVMISSFRIGIRAWEKGESELERQQRGRMAIDLITHQLASVYVAEPKSDGPRTVLFRGTDKSVEFVSLAKIRSDDPHGLVYIHYRVRPTTGGREETLKFSEEEVVFLLNEGRFEERPDETYYDLIPNVQAIEFAYLNDRADQKTSPWQNTWELERDRGFPMAVRITIAEKAGTEPIVVIARLESAGFNRESNEDPTQR